MADINVERKKPSIWPWVIGLVVLALLIWLVVEVFRGADVTPLNETGPDTTVVEATPAATPPPVSPAAEPDTSGVIPDTALP